MQLVAPCSLSCLSSRSVAVVAASDVTVAAADAAEATTVASAADVCPG